MLLLALLLLLVLASPLTTSSPHTRPQHLQLARTPFPHFQIGTIPQASDIVSDGIVRSRFKPGNSSATLNTADPWFHLYMHFSKSPSSDIAYEIVVNVDDASVAFVSIPRGRTGSFRGTSESETAMYFTCVKSGSTLVNIEVQMDAIVAAVIQVRKQCLTGNPRMGFMISSTPDTRADVVKDGRATKWFDNDLENYVEISDPSVKEDRFFVWVENTPQRFDIVTVTTDREFVTATAVLKGSNVAQPNPELQRSVLVVSYDCNSDSNGQGAVSLSLNMTGGYDPITFEWVKKCTETELDGLVLAAIVVLILILVFCVSVCCWRYFKRNERGCDIVPCAALCQPCEQCCYRNCEWCYEPRNLGSTRQGLLAEMNDDTDSAYVGTLGSEGDTDAQPFAVGTRPSRKRAASAGYGSVTS